MTLERLKQCGSFSLENHSTLDNFSFNCLPALYSTEALDNNKEILMSLECASHPDQLFLNTIFMTLWKETRNNIWWKLVFLKGLKQAMFCGTLGNRSGTLSSRKLWANINEAFKLEHHWAALRELDKPLLGFSEKCDEDKQWRCLSLFQSGFLKTLLGAKLNRGSSKTYDHLQTHKMTVFNTKQQILMCIHSE